MFSKGIVRQPNVVPDTSIGAAKQRLGHRDVKQKEVLAQTLIGVTSGLEHKYKLGNTRAFVDQQNRANRFFAKP